jgi:hypothetical protein
VPTFAKTDTFKRDERTLSPEEHQALMRGVEKFVADLKRGQGFREGLRVKSVQGAKGVLEMTWAPDGRCTFEYGPPLREGEPHIIWRRVGGHQIFDNP